MDEDAQMLEINIVTSLTTSCQHFFVTSLTIICQHFIVIGNQIKDEMDASLCRSVEVISLTTTGAACRRNVLTVLQSKIGVLKSTKKVIRIGSQSQSSLLEGYLMSVYKDNIEQERNNYKKSVHLYHCYQRNGTKKVIQDKVDDIQCLTKNLKT